MGLVSLRWRYNHGVNEIDSFDTNDIPMITTPSNPAFLSIELTEVTQLSDMRFANFTSILTVDMMQLQEQNVHDINCGDPANTDIVPVDLQPYVPERPYIDAVIAYYQSGLLYRIMVSWEKLVKLI